MKTSIFILTAALLISCSTEPIGGEPVGDNLTAPPSGVTDKQTTTTGSIKFSIDTFAPDMQGKTEVPPCDDTKLANKITVQLTDSEGKDYNETRGVAVSNGKFTMVEKLELPVSLYTVNALYLSASDGTILYSVPDVTDLRYPFSEMVALPTPFEIEVKESATASQEVEALCYTSMEFSYFGEAGFDGNSHALRPLLFYNRDCPIRLTYETYGIEYPLSGDEPLVIPVRSYSSGTLIKTYRVSDGALLDEITFEITSTTQKILHTRYDPNNGSVLTLTERDFAVTPSPEYYIDLNFDGVMDASDTITVGTNCNV